MEAAPAHSNRIWAQGQRCGWFLCLGAAGHNPASSWVIKSSDGQGQDRLCFRRFVLWTNNKLCNLHLVSKKQAFSNSTSWVQKNPIKLCFVLFKSAENELFKTYYRTAIITNYGNIFFLMSRLFEIYFDLFSFCITQKNIYFIQISPFVNLLLTLAPPTL